ncbi:DUF4442 domain-containing protein [Desulfopila inferna]|uniref:DUF4442 domain-containing protein n=1 Tax=Desulfopila inferna TaxID=468528 RepID=UPI001966C527|nr:DUF4442 domain-containing protein [Desulfopila inferna]MBM9603350.1 YiiD C-terminal domain-containing protein [Desulfopila inferna]
MNFTPRLLRFVLNAYPPYFGTGIHIDRIAWDWRRIDVSMKLRWYNRNAVKTHFGGSLYAMVDPHLMLMLMQLLGKQYIVWDKSAEIDFIRPGRGIVKAQLVVTDHDLENIHAELKRRRKVMPQFEVDITDEAGKKVAKVVKTLYVRKKE